MHLYRRTLLHFFLAIGVALFSAIASAQQAPTGVPDRPGGALRLPIFNIGSFASTATYSQRLGAVTNRIGTWMQGSFYVKWSDGKFEKAGFQGSLLYISDEIETDLGWLYADAAETRMCTVQAESSYGQVGWTFYLYTVWVYPEGDIDESKGIRFDGTVWVDASQFTPTPGEPVTCVA